MLSASPRQPRHAGDQMEAQAHVVAPDGRSTATNTHKKSKKKKPCTQFGAVRQKKWASKTKWQATTAILVFLLFELGTWGNTSSMVGSSDDPTLEPAGAAPVAIMYTNDMSTLATTFPRNHKLNRCQGSQRSSWSHAYKRCRACYARPKDDTLFLGLEQQATRKSTYSEKFIRILYVCRIVALRTHWVAC